MNFSFYYNSFDEFYETMLRGNEIEFEYNTERYFLLPHYEDEEIVGIMIGKAGTNHKLVCLSKQALYNTKIDGCLFGELLSDINILWNNL